jgi:flavin reductase (DIM6/NTAB) family NADH-FMN oxidoreductase RutF
MSKIELPITRAVGRLVAPKPTALVTCIDNEGNANIIAIAAITSVSHQPPMFMIAVREGRYSHDLIDQTKEFVINMPSIDLVEKAHMCGRSTGRSVNKFREAGLTATPAKIVGPPLIEECPINIECRVVDAVKPGTHTLFIGEVVAAHVKQGVFSDTGLNLENFSATLYNYKEYMKPGDIVNQI